MHSLQKKAFIHAAGEKSTHSDICKFAEYASIFPDCFIRENRNVAIIYYLKEKRLQKQNLGRNKVNVSVFVL
jgi:hypothetical protein